MADKDTPKFYCLECDHKFLYVSWDGSFAVCPKCGSTNWHDILEPKLPSEESPYP